MLLKAEKELCVCEISHTLESIQPRVSRHLSLLRKSKLVLDERRGQWVFYKLNNKFEEKTLLIKILDELEGCEPFSSDRKKLAQFRKNSCC